MRRDFLDEVKVWTPREVSKIKFRIVVPEFSGLQFTQFKIYFHAPKPEGLEAGDAVDLHLHGYGYASPIVAGFYQHIASPSINPLLEFTRTPGDHLEELLGNTWATP